MSDGLRGGFSHLGYRFTPNEEGFCRVLISVPKRHFKRAVKRNLLKRRIREAFRIRKSILEGMGVDIMFVYTSDDVVESEVIAGEVESALRIICSKMNRL